MIDRRSFLNALGLGAGTLFLPSLRSARADTEGPPHRLLVFFTEMGTWYDAWRMHPEGRSLDEPWQLDLSTLPESEWSRSLADLYPWRHRISVVDGLSLASAHVQGGFAPHPLAHVHALTGKNAIAVSGLPVGAGPSIDQIVAQRIARPDRFRSLEVCMNGTSEFVVNYGDARAPLPMAPDVAAFHDILFGQTQSGILDHEASMLDAVAERYSAVSRRLSAEDRQRLESHRDLVRDLERRVRGAAEVSCVAPELPEAIWDRDNQVSALSELAAVVFGCDLSRVITVKPGLIRGHDLVPGYSGNLHDEFAHQVYASAEAAEVMTRYAETHASDFARFLGALDAVPEGSGSLLDHTTVVWVTEVADGAHNADRWPVVVAGGTAFARGRYLYYPPEVPLTWFLPAQGEIHLMRQPHQRLLTSVAQAFGVETDCVGERSLPVDGGGVWDCTGRLDELF